jgi:nicotinamide phosphoribosyltransferase
MYRKEFERHAEKTGSPKDFIGWQGHDFSFRGMSGIEDACMSGGGHLLSFNGTDTVPAIKWLEQYYPSDELIGGSVPATEHSVMSMGTEYITMDDGTKIPNEFKSFKRLITELYPTGIISIVSDTFDFWKAMTEYLPRLKDKILARDGRVVIRPDSGDPADIICGLNGSGTFEESKRYYASGDDEWCNRDITETEYKGAYELLYDTFGGTVNEQGYKVLNPKVGLIYGDSINYDRQRDILARLEAKGFTASNLVLGIGSFTYEYVTRDTYGFAMKATHGVVNGEHKDIYKDPKTDDGLKKSAKGLLMVYRDDKGDIKLKDQCTQAEEQSGLLETVLHDGTYITESLTTIRKRLNNQL